MSSASTGGTEGSSPASSPASTTNQAMAAPKYGTLVPNRIFVGGIAANTSEAELAELFSAYGTVKATKIILDRGGVSKGYGFVTFETEEEAKRLQQESECIVLRERKLNIAPAIKKQIINKPFDGCSGSPPAVPTSPYGYYPNGMGIPYQNGLTFYNAGAPAPGTPLAPPTDPATLYQAAGVFGPQAASAHQTFAPMMYPCPAPSLYMPQQYQYSPMPYESYFTGAAGAPPYLYQTPSSGNGGGSGTSNGTTTTGNQNSTGATSPPTNTNHHFYHGPPPTHNLPTPGHQQQQQQQQPPPTTHQQQHHHHHLSGQGNNHHAFPDTFYYGFPGGHTGNQQGHIGQQQHINGGGIGDQQLLLYTTDCQQPASSDNQGGQQEDTRPTSTNSQTDSNNHHHQNSTQTTNLDQSTQSSNTHLSTPLVSIMPLKYPLTTPYTTYPLTLHPSTVPQSYNDNNETNSLHCRQYFYPQFYMPAYNPTSLLPTPNHHHHHHQKLSSHKPQNGNLSFFPSLHNHQTHSPKSQQVRQQIPQTPRKFINYSPRVLSNSSIKSPITYTSTKTSADSARRNLKIGFMAMKNNNGPNCDDGNGSDNKTTSSPPPAPYSPMTRPLPNFSPTHIQMQFCSAQSRYHTNQSSSSSTANNHLGSSQPRRYHQYQQHQLSSGGRKIPDKFTTGGLIVRNNKFKVNGLNQKSLDDNIGGAGDAQGARIQMTPPTTPRNVQEANSMSDACHKIQALTL